MKYFVKEGERYSRLVVLATHQRRPGKRQFYNLCLCDCGKTTYRTSTQLVRKLMKSCGCARRERLKTGNLIHGGAVRRKERGRRVGFAYLYGFWLRTRSRCHNPKDPIYPKWGERGVSLATEWREDYPSFRDWVEKHLGLRPSSNYRLARWDEKKGFEPGNLLWLTEGDLYALRNDPALN
jgi:hypothetical protein